MKKRTLKISFSILLSCIIAAIFITSLTIFKTQMSKLLRQYSLSNIEEVQSLYKSNLEHHYQTLFNILESQTRYFNEVDFSNDEELKKIIKRTKGISNFKQIAVSNTRGITTSYKGQNLANISNKDYFINCISTGEKQISDRIELDENLEPILTFAYPIKEKNQVKAVLTGTISYSMLQKHFNSNVFNGLCYTYIISHDGNIVFCNKDKNKILYNIDFYSYILSNDYNPDEKLNEMKKKLIKRESGFLELDVNEKVQIFHYTPLTINDWYIITVLPVSYIQEQQKSISVLVFILLIILLFTLVIFLLLMFYLYARNSSIEKDNERLIIANKQAQSLIFEYDIMKRSVEFSGDTQFILGTDRKTFDSEYVTSVYFNRVHTDDQTIKDQLLSSIRNGVKNFSAEFRYKTFSNDYIWLRMTGSLIFDESEIPHKFIGSLNNVNSQILHEQELKTIAEIDSLTGLLNKTAIENKIQESLNKAENKKCALFIIDLDNFKQINDQLGHLKGDLAIKDAASKLTLIFSEKDYIGRFGGDEFCIFLRLNSELTDDAINKIIRDKLQTLTNLLQATYIEDKKSVHVSASIGLAFYPENGSTYEELFHNADLALYDVKQNGKNGYKIYSPK